MVKFQLGFKELFVIYVTDFYAIKEALHLSNKKSYGREKRKSTEY